MGTRASRAAPRMLHVASTTGSRLLPICVFGRVQFRARSTTMTAGRAPKPTRRAHFMVTYCSRRFSRCSRSGSRRFSGQLQLRRANPRIRPKERFAHDCASFFRRCSTRVSSRILLYATKFSCGGGSPKTLDHPKTVVCLLRFKKQKLPPSTGRVGAFIIATVRYTSDKTSGSLLCQDNCDTKGNASCSTRKQKPQPSRQCKSQQ